MSKEGGKRLKKKKDSDKWKVILWYKACRKKSQEK